MALRPEATLEAQRAPGSEGGQEGHKFQVKRDVQLSSMDRTVMQNMALVDLIRTLRDEVGDQETLSLLRAYSAEQGRQAGTRQREQFPDTSFSTFTAQFRPPRYADSLTMEIVEDTENVFQLRVTECVWAAAFKALGMDGEMGHAAICNMDYHWPPAFNPKFRMERDHTLMQGHEYCNHRYIQDAE